MTETMQALSQSQDQRNQQLLAAAKYLSPSAIESKVLPIDLQSVSSLDDDTNCLLNAIEKTAAATSLKALASLAKINELDHLGGGLELIPTLLLSMLSTNGEASHYTIEHAHASIGYYSLLSTLGYIDEEEVVEGFRRGIDVAGHVSWLPGGTQLNGGRLGVMIPTAVGQALGSKAHYGTDGLCICHCGDAGWLAGQALNGFMGAAIHQAPIVFVMHRNGIQLSDTCANIVDIDPRTPIGALGVEILEVTSLHDRKQYFAALQEAEKLARDGKPVLIYPTGTQDVTLKQFGEDYEVTDHVERLCSENSVDINTKVWVPGSLMSWRDAGPMCECVFFVNNLPGGHGHHDGHMKGRDLETVLSHATVTLTNREQELLDAERAKSPRTVITKPRPEVGSPNLKLDSSAVAGTSLPETGKVVSPRAGVQKAYELVASQYPSKFFNVSCDLDPSTKLDKAKKHLPPTNAFEMGITEQASTMLANGLAMSSRDPQLVVFATFAAFFEGIAREGLEMWRYQRNLNGSNEGLNVAMHLSHVGACTGRDHFSGWALDWINVGISMMPYLDRFYAPADASSAYIAVCDLASRYGAHIIGVPRAEVPVLAKQDSDEPLWAPGDAWTPMTKLHESAGAKQAILAFGCTAGIAQEAASQLASDGKPTDVYVVTGLPLVDSELQSIIDSYSGGVVTVEDGLIGPAEFGLRGFAALVQTAAVGSGTKTAHVGITDPKVAPSEGHYEVWEHFGLTSGAIVAAADGLAG